MDKNIDGSYSKTLMIGILTVSGWLLYSLFLASLFVALTALSYLYHSIMYGGLYFIAALIILGLLFTIMMAISLLRDKEFISFFSTRAIWLKYFVPVARSIAKRVGLDHELVVWSAIQISNKFVINSIKHGSVKDIMIMLPHCLQLESCGRKITSDIRNCKRCGECIVDSLIELSDRLNVDIFIANGGTMARKQLASKRPDIVLAVACERDLLSGIRDILPMRAIGIINSRPDGPCVNTTVDIAQIDAIVAKIKI